MDRELIIRLAREAGLWEMLEGYANEYVCGNAEEDCLPELQRFAALVAAHKEKEMQERIDALFALYEQACQQRDQLMDMQRAQIAAMRGRTQ